MNTTKKVKRIWIHFEDGSHEIYDITGNSLYRVSTNYQMKPGTGIVEDQWESHELRWHEHTEKNKVDPKIVAVLDAEDSRKLEDSQL